MKLCKECKYFGLGNTCHSPKLKYKNDPVNGAKELNLALYQRADDLLFMIINGSCGKIGRFFEQKDETND